MKKNSLKILVLSDSHHHPEFIKKIFCNEKNIETTIFLGDGLDDLEVIPSNIQIYSVQGNMDFSSVKVQSTPLFQILSIHNHRFFLTHGHLFNARYTHYNMYEKAQTENCEAVLFGHTHNPLLQIIKGIYFFNPGALKEMKYGVITLNKNDELNFSHRSIK